MIALRELLSFGRRLFTGAIAAYVAASLLLGGTLAARPVFGASVAAWGATLACKRYRGWRRAESGKGRAAAVLGSLELIAFNLALTLVLGELALRAFAAASGNALLLRDTLDAYRLVPGRDYGNGLRGNSLGYPGPEFQAAKRPGVYRIAALGDSFAVGPAVPFAENYLTRLEQALPGSEVYNFGVSSTGPREYYAILKQHAERFQPDLVLVAVFVGNDITEWLATPRYMDPRQHCLYLLLARGGRLLRERWRRPASTPTPGPTGPAPPPLSEQTFREVEARRLAVCMRTPPPSLEKKWQRAFAYLDRIIRECRRRRIAVAFVLIPDEFQVNPEVLAGTVAASGLAREALDLRRPQRRLGAFCSDRGVPCLDLLPAFENVPDTYAWRDTHWNVRGNRLAAQCLGAWLRAEGRRLQNR